MRYVRLNKSSAYIIILILCLAVQLLDFSATGPITDLQLSDYLSLQNDNTDLSVLWAVELPTEKSMTHKHCGRN